MSGWPGIGWGGAAGMPSSDGFQVSLGAGENVLESG